PADDPDAHRGDLRDEEALHPVRDERGGERDVASGDRRRAGPAVRLEHVAVDGDGPLAETCQVDDAAQRPADEALDLMRPPADPAAGRFPLRPLGRCPGEHRVLGRDPAGALATEMRRDPIGDRRGTQHLGVADADAARSLGPLLDAERERDRPELIRASAVAAGGGRTVADRHWISSDPPAARDPAAATARASRSEALAASQSASSAAKSRSRSAVPCAAASRSTSPKRRRNLSFAARRAASAWMPWRRATLTSTMSRSPSSS